MTSEFNQGVFAQPSNAGVLFDSSDQKSKLLKSIFGEEIFGLGSNAKQDYLKDVSPVLISLLIDSLNNKVA